MKFVIRLAPPQELRALPILLRHSPGTVLPDRTYVIEHCSWSSVAAQMETLYRAAMDR